MAAPWMNMNYPRRANDDGLLLLEQMVRRVPGGVPQLLLDSGRAFILVAALVLIPWRQVDRRNAERVLAAYLLWLLGAGLAMLSLVAGQFPRLAAAGAALARALRNYVLGGL